MLTLGQSDDPEAGLKIIKQLEQELNIPGLASYGLTPEHFPELTLKSSQSSSMKGNPIVLTEDELTQILSEAL